MRSFWLRDANGGLNYMIGETLGSYRVVAKLGEGGMGVVYRAEHPMLKKLAVAKLLHAELSKNDEIVERFFNEARAATLVRHPGIVDVFDFGYHESGCAFILMELLHGESLGDRLRGGKQGEDLTVFVGQKIASAVGAAHGHGIVHRDLKPDNVFLVPDQDSRFKVGVKVLDFGIAKLAGGEAATALRTQTGTVMGTPTYMAPEQCRSAASVDHRADIYALGCILYEMACGRPPFLAGSLGQMIAAQMFEPPTPPRAFAQVPADLEAVILRALAKAPDERPASMAALANELAACGAATTAAAVSPPSSTAPHDLATPREPASADGAPPSPAQLAGVAVRAPSPILSTTLGQSAGELSVEIAAGASSGMTASEENRPRRKLVVVAVLATAGLAIGGAGLLSGGAPDSNPPAAARSPASATETAAAQPPLSASVPGDAVADASVTAKEPIAEVTLKIESQPSGAAVHRAVDGTFIGRTPFEETLGPTPGTVVYVLKLDRYREQSVEFASDRDDSKRVTLVPIPRDTRSDRTKPRRGTAQAQKTEQPRRTDPEPSTAGTLAPRFEGKPDTESSP